MVIKLKSKWSNETKSLGNVNYAYRINIYMKLEHGFG